MSDNSLEHWYSEAVSHSAACSNNLLWAPWGVVMLENMNSILWQIIMTPYSGEEGVRMDISVYKESKHTEYLIALSWLPQRYEHTVAKQSEGGAESVEEPKHTE